VAANEKHKFAVLDGMRGLAALGVLTFHVNQEFGVPQWLPSGYLAVDLFFILSGFVIAHAYDRRIAAGMGVRHFLKMRVIRLYPLYFLALVLLLASLAVALVFGHDVSANLGEKLTSLPYGLLMVPDLQNLGSSDPAFPLNPPSWSLFFELVINIAFVVFWKRLDKQLLTMVAAISGLALVWLANTGYDLAGGWGGPNLIVGLCRVSYSFPVGVILYRMRGSSVGRFGVSAIALVGTVALMAPSQVAGFYPDFYDLVAILLISPLLVALGANCSRLPSWIENSCLILGTASYGIYILHTVLILPFKRVAQWVLPQGLTENGALMTVCYTATIVMAALFSSKYYDRPVRTWLSRLAGVGTGMSSREQDQERP
jgi:peptidoglycan/LPS O-acetylase OafA/YrhL